MPSTTAYSLAGYDTSMRWLLLLLVACGPGTVERRKDGTFAITGKVMKRVAHCSARPAPKPFPGGEIAIASNGKIVAQPKADKTGKYTVELAPGEYCVRATDATDCYVRWELPAQGEPAKTPDTEIVITEYDMKGCD